MTAKPSFLLQATVGFGSPKNGILLQNLLWKMNNLTYEQVTFKDCNIFLDQRICKWYTMDGDICIAHIHQLNVIQ